MSVRGREILLGVTGGIAAYKACDLTSKLVQAGASVRVIMTEAAHRFVGAATFEALTGRPVVRDMFVAVENFRGEHIALPQQANCLVIAPASADFLAKMAHGLADDLLSTTVLVATCPILVAPAMNCDMWAKPAVQRNVDQLKLDGVQVIEPGDGWLSCGQKGQGRMAEVAEILSALNTCLG